MGFLADLLIRIGGDADDLKKALSGSRRDLQSWGRDLNSIGTTMTAAVSVPLAGVGIAALKVAGDLEQQKIAFTTMMKSADEAQKHLNDLKDFALHTPFQFNDLVLASKRMQALGFEAKAVLPALRNIGDAAAALGMGSEGIQRIVTALGQMQAKGKVQAEEMRQLAEAGIPAWQILAKTLNTDVAGAMKMVEQRAVDAGTAVPAILAGINERFGGLMEQQSKTLLGQFSNFKDALTFTLQDVGKTLAPVAKNVLENVLQPMLEKLKDLAAGFAALSPTAQQAVIAVGAFAVALGPAAIVTSNFLNAISSLVGIALKLPALLNPVSLAIVAIGTAAAFAFAELSKGTSKLRSLDKEFSEFITKRVKETKDFEATREQLRAALDSGAIGLSDYNQALAILSDREKKAFGEEARAMLGGWTVTVDGAKEAVEGLAEEIDRFKPLRFDQSSLEARQLARNVQEAWAVMSMWASDLERGVMDRELDELYERLEALKQPAFDLRQYMLDLGAAMSQTAYDAAALDEALRNLPSAKPPVSLTDPKIWTGTIRQAAKEMSAFERDVRRAFDAVARGIARNVIEWKGWKDTIISVGKDLAAGFMEIMLKQLLKPLENAFASLAGKLSGVLGGVFGGAGSAAASGASAAAGGAASAGGGAASAASKAASTGFSSIANVVTGAVSAVSGVIGNFQFMGMNKSLDIIVKHTLQTANDLANLRADEWDREGHLMLKLDDIWNEIRNVVRQQSVNVYLDSKLIWKGLANQAQLQGIG